MHLERSFPLLFSLMLAAAPLADARHHYRSRLPNGSRVPCPSPGVSDCDQLCGGVGHVSCAGGSASPHLNAFGKVPPLEVLGSSTCGTVLTSLSAGFSGCRDSLDEGAVREGLRRGRIHQWPGAGRPLLRVERGGDCQIRHLNRRSGWFE